MGPLPVIRALGSATVPRLAFLGPHATFTEQALLTLPEAQGAELVPCAEAIRRLEVNGGWPGIQEPLWAYLRGEARAGTIWFYREDQGVQSLVASIAP